MISGVNIQFEGMSEIEKFLSEEPKRVDAAVLDSLKVGCRTLRKEIVAKMPATLKKFSPIFDVKSLSKMGGPSVMAGFFGKKIFYRSKKGVSWDAFQLVFWSNYGTLANRDPSFPFGKSRRAVSAWYKGGIRPLKFWDNNIDQALASAQVETNKNFDILLENTAKYYGIDTTNES